LDSDSRRAVALSDDPGLYSESEVFRRGRTEDVVHVDTNSMADERDT
jgi:hypothetical protein